MFTRHYLRNEADILRSLRSGKNGYILWFLLRGLPGVLLSALLLMLLSIRPVQSQELDQLGPDGVESGQMLFRENATSPYLRGIVLAGKTHFDISGLVASVSVEQTFRNESDVWVEGVYAFPLPDNAAVRHMEMIIGERRIIGKIKEKALAKEMFNQAKKAGKKASLVEQHRPNLFLNRIANIAPGEEVTVRLEYVQAVQYSAGEFSVRFPMTITPRYRLHSTSAESIEVAPELLIEALVVDALVGWVIPPVRAGAFDSNAMKISANVNMGMPLAEVTSPYHEIALSREQQRYTISLAHGKAAMDRDFVLRWRPVTASTPTAAVFKETVAGEEFGLLMLLPPAGALTSSSDVLSREIIFVVDTSGSMGGESIAQARRSLLLALEQLGPSDFFNIIEFNSTHRAFFKAAVPASKHYVYQAKKIVSGLMAGGGTDMLPALQLALQSSPSQREDSSAAGVRQVIFITDGAVGNEQQLFTEIAGSMGDTRLFTVGIGSAPNSWFMRKAAQFGRGSHTHIGNIAEVAEKMQGLFRQISSPVTTNIEIDWPGEVEAYPAKVPDLFLGEPLLVAFRYSNDTDAADIQIKGESANGLWSKQIVSSSTSADAAQTSPGVASLWARKKIASLLDEKAMGKPEEWVRDQVLSVALTHKLMSPYTSFVAIEERISRPSNMPVLNAKVPQLLPQGTAVMTAYPATATTGPAKFFLGSLLLFIALMIHMMRQPEPGAIAETEADYDSHIDN
jgi:Ca-activated chloride channel family protein